MGKTGKGENRAKAGPIDEEGVHRGMDEARRRMGNVEVEREEGG